MNGYNKVILVGNLVADPEEKATPNGTRYASFRLAVNRKYMNGRGDLVDDPLFVNITVWGKTGDSCLKYLSKGRPVLVDGRLEIRRYEGQDGVVRFYTSVVANNVVFLGSGSGRRNTSESIADMGEGLVSEETFTDAGNNEIVEEIPF